MERVRVQVLIITPLSLEYNAVIKHLDNVTDYDGLSSPCKIGYFDTRTSTIKVAVVESEPSISKVSSVTTESIKEFHPEVAFLTGVCGGIKDVGIGDLIVATEASGYELGKETDNGFSSRPNVLPFDRQIIKLAKKVRDEGYWKKRAGYGSQSSKVEFGLITSGDKVVATNKQSIYKIIKAHHNNALGVEMESIGFARACFNLGIRCANIRAASDLLSGKAASDARGNQELVVQYAVGFLFELVWYSEQSFFKIEDMSKKGEQTSDNNFFQSKSENESKKTVQRNKNQNTNMKARIIRLIERNFIDDALKLLKEHCEKTYSSFLTIVNAKITEWNALKKKTILGLLSAQEQGLQERIFVSSLLDLINEIFKEEE